MKKYMSFMLVMLLLVLAACSNKTGGDQGKTGDAKHPSGTITVWGWDVAAATMKAAVKDFQKKYPDVKVKVEDFNSGDLYEKLTVGLAARGSGLPDVVLMEDERIPGYVHQFPEGFLNLNKLGYGNHKDSFNPAKVAPFRIRMEISLLLHGILVLRQYSIVLITLKKQMLIQIPSKHGMTILQQGRRLKKPLVHSYYQLILRTMMVYFK